MKEQKGTTKRVRAVVRLFPSGSPARSASARQLIANALQAARLAEPGKRTWQSFPQLRTIAERFAWYLSDAIPHPRSRKSLLELSLRDAFTWMSDRQARDREPITRDAMVAFVAGLINRTPYLLEVRVVGRGGVEWSPFSKEALCDFSARHGPLDVQRGLTEIRPPTIKLYVATHLLHAPELVMIGGNVQAVTDYRHG